MEACMADSQHEQTYVSNSFGSVTSRRVIYNRKKGWFSGGSREDIPLRHVTAVRLEISRHILGGILCLLIGLPMLFSPLLLVGGVFCLLGGLCLWGWPAVIVNTSGQDLRPAKGLPWDRKEADAFVDALRAQLFRE